MWRTENTGRQRMECDSGQQPRSRGVYMRVKRLRFDDNRDDKDVAPPLLRVRLDDGTSSGSSSEKGSLSHDVLSTPSLTALAQQSCTLQFRLLSKVGDGTCGGGREAPSTQRTAVSSSTPVLSVERVWDLRGCVVMDCCTAAGSSLTDMAASAQKNSGVAIGSAAALKDSKAWSLYVLDNRHVDDNEDKQEEKEEDVEVEMREEDEFGFDDLVVTRPNDSDNDNDECDDIAINNDKKTFAYANKHVSHRVKRKRQWDETVPDYILSMGIQPWDGEGCNFDTSPEDEALIYEMLRDHGQNCFFLEEENGCERELYVYPDHRKDDEYDSNAADFSGNEYPEEPSESNTSVIGSECSEYDDDDDDDDKRHYKRRQGDLWYEESYRETSLSSGWNSCDDGY
ncbi:hypothetical protein LSM04_006725 [Trypanosoma melophagium]|uniref:uncharacterized protein n=1 Tax=Trypanosoma melophagium TaxID=715481 RepID=UPI00351A9519|nr:hypothetical protein LSM04_006725 [Trypanosoma melophagium]